MIYLIVGVTVLTLLLIDLSLRVYFGRKGLQLLEKMPPFRVESTPPQKQAIPFTAQTPDGLTLRGSIYHPDEMPPKGVILFCAETIASHWSAIKYCQALIESGFIVISFDFRNQGESDSMAGYESLHWVTEYEVADLKTILNWIQEQDSLRGLPMGIMGVSRGASTAMMALAECPQVNFLCSDSGYTNDQLIWHYLERWAPIIVPDVVIRWSPSLWHLKKTLDAAIWFRGFKRNCRYLNKANPFERMTGKKVLLISGANDSYVPTRIARELAKMLGPQCEEVWVVPKAAHNGARSKCPELYDARIVAFFDQMAVPASQPVERIPSQRPVHNAI